MAFFSFPYWNLRRKILRPYFLGSGPLELAWWLAGLKLFISWKIRKESSVLDREGDGAHLLSPVTVFSEFVLSLWKCHWWNSEETPQSCLLFISYILNTGKLEKDCACHVYGKNKIKNIQESWKDYNEFEMPDLDRFIRWASLDMKIFCCWCW